VSLRKRQQLTNIFKGNQTVTASRHLEGFDVDILTFFFLGGGGRS
jgi:hypothetical protein